MPRSRPAYRQSASPLHLLLQHQRPGPVEPSIPQSALKLPMNPASARAGGRAIKILRVQPNPNLNPNLVHNLCDLLNCTWAPPGVYLGPT